MSDDSLIAGIWVRDEVRQLTSTIKKLDNQNQKLQNRMYWLTCVTVLLALVQVTYVVVQLIQIAR